MRQEGESLVFTRATPLVKRITIMTIRITIMTITFGGEGTPDLPLLERAHQTLPSRGGTPGPPLGKVHQTLLGRVHQTLPTLGKQCIAGAGARLLLAPIRGQVLVSACPQQNQAGSAKSHIVPHSDIVHAEWPSGLTSVLLMQSAYCCHSN